MSTRWPDKIVVGLTGNIATGKSVIMHMAAEHGALAIDADKLVHELMNVDWQIQAAVEAIFGAGVRRPDGRIDRQALGDIVFKDPQAMRELEAIIHPAVRRVLFERIGASEARVVFVEAIKLLEGGLADECDQVWVTRCPKEIQIRRLVVCRGLDETAAQQRIAAQPPQEEKVAQAEVVIDTDQTMAATRAYFELAWAKLLRSQPAGSMDKAAEDGQARSQLPPEPPDAPAMTTAAPMVEKGRRTPPERLTPSAAAVLRKKYQLDQPVVGEEPEATGEHLEIDEAAEEDLLVRRARPSDVPAILLLMRRAAKGASTVKRSELLMALGDRGYLIGQQGTEISAIAGWSSENQIARIDQIFVYPPEAAPLTGAAVLQEIEDTAIQLICEVILAFPPHDISEDVRQLLLSRGFSRVDAEVLPRAWRLAVIESQPDGTFVMMKRLRDTRIMPAT